MADVGESFLIIQEGEAVERYELGPEAKYVQDWETIRVWDTKHTYVIQASKLVALRVCNKT